ncbi:MAG: 50S ribosomal protein L31 [Chloroflexi bacterium]|nr:50S ribosomal protein L31 [Chloroflexota bacterium]
MKEKIHPKYFPEAKVVCACGNTFVTGSTRKELRVEICSKCHPFYTGEKRMMDAAGRVERFRKRYAATTKAKEEKAGREAKAKEKKAAAEEAAPAAG